MEPLVLLFIFFLIFLAILGWNQYWDKCQECEHLRREKRNLEVAISIASRHR